VWITLRRCLSGLVFAEQAYTILDCGGVLVIGLTDKVLDIKLQIDDSSYIKKVTLSSILFLYSSTLFSSKRNV
jgi:hypothetical protein